MLLQGEGTRCFAGGWKNAGWTAFIIVGGGGGEGVNTCIPKQAYIPVICQDTRARACVCLSVYVGCLEPHVPPLDPYILDACDLFVLLCHMLGMSSIK